MASAPQPIAVTAMLDILPREQIRALAAAAKTVAPTTCIGYVTALDDDRVAVHCEYAFGLGGFALGRSELLDALQPWSADRREADGAAIAAGRSRAAEAFLLDNRVQRLVSFPLAGVEPASRLWIGLAGAEALTPAEWDGFAAIAADAARLLLAPRPAEAHVRQLVRLEQAAALIPALLHVLDVREVIDRLSLIARPALPHDLLLLNLFAEDFSTFTVYARSDRGAGLGMVLPNPYPAATIRAWTYGIVDDQRLHPLEQHAPATRIGARTTMRFPIRFDDRVIGGVAFASFTPNAYSDADVPVGRRLADHVASAVSHFQLAERLAEQARRTEVLRAQATNLALLDALLAALVDTGDLSDVFERVSGIAAKVLRHDALALLVRIGDGRRHHAYATRGFPTDAPDVTDVPAELLERSDWDHDIVDDVAAADGYAGLAALDFHGLLRVPIRLDGRVAGALVFVSKQAAAFAAGDVLVAHRMADRLAVTLARDRVLEVSRRADEAAERAARLEARVRALTDELDARTGHRRVVGESPQWRRVLTQATQVAATETTALLLGESGTGKEVIARFLHRASGRKGGPFVALNCAALPEQLLEAELFGYERGAYTGATQSKPGQLELASGGTLFLDEVGEMSPSAQAKFLRVLQEREFQRLGGTRVLRTDARIVAATNRDLLKMIGQGQFREDLYYRLNVFPIRLPALRDRRDDILPLSDAFLQELGRTLGRPPGGVSRDARTLLLDYHWPGNVRELRNILERAAILCDGGLITADHLALAPPAPARPVAEAGVAPLAAGAGAGAAAGAAAEPAGSAVPAGDLAGVERSLIEQALQVARFNKSKAAKALGLTRHQLYIRMRRHGFE